MKSLSTAWRYTSFALIVTVGLASCVVVPARGEGRVIRVAPPPARVVVVPAPRRGYVWAPGYWRWNGKRHVWIDGHWVRERRGYLWVADRWDDRGGHWVYVPGHWERGR